MANNEIEIELPANFVRNLLNFGLIVFLSIGLIVIGYLVSPKSEDGQPLILSPSFAQVKKYQDLTRGWVGDLERIDESVSTILSGKVSDIFVQNDRANQAAGEVAQVLEKIDSSAAPQTLVQLRSTVLDAAVSYDVAIEKVSVWIGEPTEANFTAAKDALASARAALNRAKNNPWILESVKTEKAGSE